MTTEYLGRGDPRRTLEALWGRPRKGTRGPRQGLTVESMVRAAIELADRDGLGALSMRRVAERLGVGTMSLYTYVPTKAELLDLMVDAVYAEHVEALERLERRLATERTDRRLRSTLDGIARVGWDLYLRHRFLLYVASSRGVLGPNETAVQEVTLRMIDGHGLTSREMVALLDALGTYVRGSVRGAVEAMEAPARTGMSDEEWWKARSELLGEFLGERAADFPTITRVSETGGYEASGPESYTLRFALDDFEFGLERLLEGVDAFAARRRSGSDTEVGGRGAGALGSA
jgi:AcrR family transcriptional regulator